MSEQHIAANASLLLERGVVAATTRINNEYGGNVVLGVPAKEHRLGIALVYLLSQEADRLYTPNNFFKREFDSYAQWYEHIQQQSMGRLELRPAGRNLALEVGHYYDGDFMIWPDTTAIALMRRNAFEGPEHFMAASLVFEQVLASPELVDLVGE